MTPEQIKDFQNEVRKVTKMIAHVSDTNLIALIDAAMSEGTRRDVRTKADLANIVADQKDLREAEMRIVARERARIKQEKIRQAEQRIETEMRAKKIADQWERQSQFAKEVYAACGEVEDLTYSIWSNGADKRIYFKQGDAFRGAEIVTIYVTGNLKKKPGTVEWGRKEIPNVDREKLVKLLTDEASHWKSLRGLRIDEARA